MSDSESAVSKVVADVMLYDSQMQRWVSASSPGPSDVYILLNVEKQQYRIVGRKTESGDLTINCGIIGSLVYNEATAKFHQWRANGQVYGMNFADEDYAKEFGQTMQKALQQVKGLSPWPVQAKSEPPPQVIPQKAPPPSGPPAPPSPKGPPPPGPPPVPKAPPPPGPPGPTGPPRVPGPPMPSGITAGAGKPKGAGRGALLSSIEGGFKLKKVGIRENAGPGRVVGEPADESRPAPAPSRPSGAPMDFRDQLKMRLMNQTQSNSPKITQKNDNYSLPRPQKQLPSVPVQPKAPPPSQPKHDGGASNDEIRQFIRDELEKMKLSLLSEVRTIVREEMSRVKY